MTHPPHRDWNAISWPDMAAGETAGWIAVLPLAATEQHGPHLPLGTDTMIAEAYLARVREVLPANSPATILPTMDIGVSPEHANFPGTLTLPPELAIRTWIAIGEGVARAGLRKLMMISSHGGNSAAMDLAARELRANQGLFVVTASWSRFGVPDGLFSADEMRFGIHAGAVETSIMLAAYENLVRRDKIADNPSRDAELAAKYKWLSAQRPAPFAWMAEDLNASGAVGDARAASAEKGRALIEHGAVAFCELLEEIAAFDLKSLGENPQA